MADKEQPLTPIEYKLTYRHRKTLHSVNFKHIGDYDSAMVKARNYCKSQSTDFINIEPLFIDLELSISKKNNPEVERIPGRAY